MGPDFGIGVFSENVGSRVSGLSSFEGWGRVLDTGKLYVKKTTLLFQGLGTFLTEQVE